MKMRIARLPTLMVRISAAGTWWSTKHVPKPNAAEVVVAAAGMVAVVVAVAAGIAVAAAVAAVAAGIVATEVTAETAGSSGLV